MHVPGRESDLMKSLQKALNQERPAEKQYCIFC